MFSVWIQGEDGIPGLKGDMGLRGDRVSWKWLLENEKMRETLFKMIEIFALWLGPTKK